MAPAMRRGNDKSNGGMLTRIVEQVVPTVIDSIDLNRVLDKVDINALLEDVDVDALVARIDIDALLDRVDVEGIIDRVDINGIVQRVDIDGLLDERRRGEHRQTGRHRRPRRREHHQRRRIGSRPRPPPDRRSRRHRRSVRQSRHGARRRGHEAGTRAAGAPPRKPGPRRERRSDTGQVTGRFAGPVSRLAAFAVDSFAIVALYGVIVAIIAFTVKLVTGYDVNTDNTTNGWWLLGYVLWAFLYFWVSTAITGRTAGKWLIGTPDRGARRLTAAGPRCLHPSRSPSRSAS